METHLAVTAAARKERLIALRKRKDAHDAGETAETHFTFKQRNFDPETRQARRGNGAAAEEDTVEKAVEGLAEEILREDEERRAEELVSEHEERASFSGTAECLAELRTGLKWAN